MTVSVSHADGRHSPGFTGCLIQKSTERGKETGQNTEKRKNEGTEEWLKSNE